MEEKLDKDLACVQSTPVSSIQSWTSMVQWFIVSYDSANKQKHYKKSLH